MYIISLALFALYVPKGLAIALLANICGNSTACRKPVAPSPLYHVQLNVGKACMPSFRNTKHLEAVAILLIAPAPPSLAWGHPTNFSMWSGDILYSKLYNLAEILLDFKSAKIHFKHHFNHIWHF